MAPVYLDFKTMGEDGYRIFMNFITYHDEANHFESDVENVKKYVAEEFNAVYVVVIRKSGMFSKHYIRFSDPKDLTAFLLRFS